MVEVRLPDIPIGDGDLGDEARVRAAMNITGDLTKAIGLADQIHKAPQSRNPFLPTLMKSAGSGDMSGLFSALNRMRDAMAPDLAKEIDFATFTDAIPTTLGFNVFDLSGPARAQYPIYAPIRSRIPRQTTQGPAHMAKLLTGISGSGTGGLADVNPAFNVAVPTAGSNLEAARGNEISYAQADAIFAAKWHALRTGVTWPAFYSGQGFQDLRSMAATILMQAGMQAEEKAMVFGRDSTLSAPTITSGTARDPLSGKETGITGSGSGGTNVYIKVTAIGAFGESAASGSTTVNIANSATKVIDVVIGDVTGALGYKVYASTADTGGSDPGDNSRWYYGATGWNKFTIGVSGRLSSGSHVPSGDTGSGSTDNYRGIIQTIEAGPALGTSVTGYSTRVNAAPSAASISFLQDAFASMFDSVKADPEEVWFDNHIRRKISDVIITLGASSPYRFTYERDGQGNLQAGGMVSAVQNESSLSGRIVPLKTHPWMPKGNGVILSYALPFPATFGQANVMEMVGPADFQQVSWAPTTMRYESSLYWFNCLAIYAPAFCGVIHGLAQNDDNTAGPLL